MTRANSPCFLEWREANSDAFGRDRQLDGLADRGELKIREFQHEYGKDEVLFHVKIVGQEIDEQIKGGEGPCGGTH